jgi:hypothetical protein
MADFVPNDPMDDMDGGRFAAQPDDKESPAAYGDTATSGPWLDPTTKLGKLLRDTWSLQRDRYARMMAEGEVNERRRAGDTNVWAVKTQDQARWVIYSPPGASKVPVAVLNKPARLCSRFVAALHPDKALPDAQPAGEQDEDRESAQFANQVLLDLDGESGLNDEELHRAAQDSACNWGSNYLLYLTSPTAGGMHPITIQAHPQALTEQEAALAPGPVDPMTGMPGPGMPADPNDLILRYVTADGTLTDQPGEAATRWMPKLVGFRFTPASVRRFPLTSADIWDADKVVIAAYLSLGTCLDLWPDQLEGLSLQEQKDLIHWRGMPDSKPLLPRKMGEASDVRPPEGLEHEGLVLVLIGFARACRSYPNGAYVVVAGEDTVLQQGEWVGTTTEGAKEPRDIPLTQIIQWRGDRDHPDGSGLMHFFGPAGEFRAELYGNISDYNTRANNRKTFVPYHSTYQPQDAQLAFSSIVPIPPGGAPTFEQVPEMPQSLPMLLDRLDRELDDASSLQQTGQGLSAPGVDSGRHALAIVQQVNQGLSDPHEYAKRAKERSWRIKLQAFRFDYTIPQVFQYVGEDGAYRTRYWMGSDLGGTRDVRILAGTGSLMNPLQKAQVLSQLGQLAGIPSEDVSALIGTMLPQVTGLPDNPFLQRIRRQIETFESGPPQGWTPPPPPPPPIPTVVGADPMGQPMMGPPPPPPPPPEGDLWQWVPSDVLPVSAGVRVRELAKVTAKARYLNYPGPWRVGLEQEFARMQQALAPPPMAPNAPQAPGKPAGPGGPGGMPGPGGTGTPPNEKAVLSPLEMGVESPQPG